jgi:hypothetical protein
VKQAVDGTDAVLLCCSQDSLRSKWVAAEIDYCLERERSTGRTILIPILLDDVRFVNRFGDLGERLAADCRSWRSGAETSESMEKIRSAVDKTITQRPATAERGSA